MRIQPVTRWRAARLRYALGVLVALVVLLAACSGSSSDQADPSDVSDASDVSSASDAIMPFDAVLLELFGTTRTDEYLTRIEREAAELVVTCMNDAGFEFVLPDQPATYVPPDPADRAAAAQDGFGIISGYRFDISQIDLAAMQSVDPNVAYLSTLSTADVARFYLTLDGPTPEPGQQRTGGCNGDASDQAYGEWKRFLDLLPNYTVLGEERDTHPDWMAAREVWKQCMRDKGYDYTEPDAIRTDVIRRMRATVEAQYPGGQLPLTAVDGVAALDPAVEELLDELLVFEQQAAVANVDCTAPLADRFDAAERLVQQEYINRHQAQIDELLAG